MKPARAPGVATVVPSTSPYDRVLVAFGPSSGAATSLHTNQAWGQIGEIAYHLLSLERLLQNRFATTFNAVNLNHVLCQVDTNCRNVHFGRLFWFVVMSHLHIGTQMPVREGATIPLHKAELQQVRVFSTMLIPQPKLPGITSVKRQLSDKKRTLRYLAKQTPLTAFSQEG